MIALMQRAPTVRELMMHPTVTALSDRHLLANCTKWQLNVSAALEVGPGARDQVLHREEDLFPYFPLPRPNLILAMMLAVSDFTVDNGGTRLVPGSHRWAADRTARDYGIVRAEMPAGSCCSGSATLSTAWALVMGRFSNSYHREPSAADVGRQIARCFRRHLVDADQVGTDQDG